MSQIDKKGYLLTIDYQEGSSSYETFKNVASLMLAIDELNNAIARSFSEEIETEAIIEDITAGSIKIWLQDKLKKIPDDKIKSYINNPKEAISDFLIAVKHQLIKLLETEPENINKKAPAILKAEIDKTGLNQIGYTIHKIKLLEALDSLSNSAKSFDIKPKIEIEGEKMVIIDNYVFDPEEVEGVEKQTHTIRDKFIIKKPDLVGSSKWTVIFDKNIDVKIEDETFIEEIKNRRISIAHGDMLDAELKIETYLDKEDLSVIDTKYHITKVFDVVPPNDAKQPPLIEGK